MLRNKIKKIICAILLTCSLLCGSILTKTTNSQAVTSLNNQSKITVNVDNIIKQDKGKILIYHSHSNEKNTNSTIQDVAKDLKLKLERKGFIVEYIDNDFAYEQGYNRSYYSSRKMLESKSLNEYILTIDIHMDSTLKPVSTTFNDNQVAKLMFPNTSENPNLKNEQMIVNNIRNNLDKFDKDIYRENTTNYKQGIKYYNLDLAPNMLLIEVGSNTNDFLSCQRACTLLASAIDKTFENK